MARTTTFWRGARERTAFTLIELLVVIAVITLLMAILLPTLRRVKRQARAVACRSNLRQWGVAICAYTADNNGNFPKVFGTYRSARSGEGYPYPMAALRDYCDSNDLFLCPMATKPRRAPSAVYAFYGAGDTFSAWSWGDSGNPGGPIFPTSRWFHGSYGFNEWLRDQSRYQPGGMPPWWLMTRYWRSCLVRGAGTVPVYYDCAY